MKKKSKKENKEDKKTFFAVIIIIIAIILFCLFLSHKNNENADEKIVKCIASKTKLYVQLGCHACQKQEKIFGDLYKLLNVTDCFYEPEKCRDIKYVPTWIINGKQYIGVKSIDELRNLTGC